MKGKLYVIGIGPGDPELLTLKAARILREVPCIAVPRGKEEGESLALSIIEKTIDLGGKDLIEAYFPMQKTKDPEGEQGGGPPSAMLEGQWRKTALAISRQLDSGRDVAFITLGDPALYSTFYYLYGPLLDLQPQLKLEIVPGVSSLASASALAKTPLGLAGDKIAIIPANYPGDLKEVVENFETVIFLKVHRNLPLLKEVLKSFGRTRRSFYVRRAGMAGELVIEDVGRVDEEDLDYFSLVVVKR